MDNDYVFYKNEPPTLMTTSTPAEIAKSERWEKSIRLSMMSIKSHIMTSIHGSIPECKNLRNWWSLLTSSLSLKQALARTPIRKLSTGTKRVNERIMQMRT